MTCCYLETVFHGHIYHRCDIQCGVSWLQLDHQWGQHWLHFRRTIQQRQIHWINLQHSQCHLHRITFQHKIIHKSSRRIFHSHTIERTEATAALAPKHQQQHRTQSFKLNRTMMLTHFLHDVNNVLYFSFLKCETKSYNSLLLVSKEKRKNSCFFFVSKLSVCRTQPNQIASPYYRWSFAIFSPFKSKICFLLLLYYKLFFFIEFFYLIVI